MAEQGGLRKATRIQGGQPVPIKQERNTSPKPSLPKIHTQVEQWSRRKCLQMLQIYECENYNVHFQKFSRQCFFKPSYPTYTYCIFFASDSENDELHVCSEELTLGLSIQKMIGFQFFCSGCNPYLILYKYILCLFFSASSAQRFLLMPKNKHLQHNYSYKYYC